MEVCETDLPFEISEVYESVKNVYLHESSKDIHLKLIDGSKVRVECSIGSKPEFQDGRLSINRLQGNLVLPKDAVNMEINIMTSSGDIEGDVAHKGMIASTSGDINIDLYAPIKIATTTIAGDIDVVGMISQGRGIFIPPNGKSIGILVIDTTSGDINVKYKKEEKWYI